jgi:hypothetical protein
MKTTRESKVPPEKQLCILAREFRGTRDERQRAAIARRYAHAVRQLIEGKKWKRIPSMEDQLPDEWMPKAFFQHWSLIPPPTRIGKPTILLEGAEDVAVLKSLLRSDLLEDCDLQAAGGQPNLAAAAHNHFLKRSAPVAILLDTNTFDQTVIDETVKALNESVESVAGDIPFVIVSFVPHVEAIFFNGVVDLKRIFPNSEKVLIPELARTDPKRQLDALFENGGGPGSLTEFLDQLASSEVKKLRNKDPIRQLMTFIKKNSDAA